MDGIKEQLKRTSYCRLRRLKGRINVQKAKVGDERKVTEKVMVKNKKFISNKRSLKETARSLFNGSSNLLTKEITVLRN